MSADEANARVEALGRKRIYAAPTETFELDAETLAKYAAKKPCEHVDQVEGLNISPGHCKCDDLTR